MERAVSWHCRRHVIDLSEPVVMGIVNVTPDSFSDGGLFEEADIAVEHGIALALQGAAIVDVGGESTRPGAGEVTPADETTRVLPVILGLTAKLSIPVSIDTRHPEVAGACLAAGASIVNDVSGFRDPAMVEVVAGSDCGCVVMHMLGEPKTMQSEPPVYEDVVVEVGEYLVAQASMLQEAGVARERIAIDPGIGFGKTVQQNLELVAGLGSLAQSGYPVVLGASRKSFIGAVLDIDDPADRLAGSLAVAALGVGSGAQIIRAHDVAETVQVVKMASAATGDVS